MLFLLASLACGSDSSFQDLAVLNISLPDRRGSELPGGNLSSSADGVKHVYADWTIIGRSASVTSLGYSVAISGSKVGITQSTGAYLSMQADKRLFAPGEDKVFVHDPAGELDRAESRMAICTMPTNTNDVQAIAAIGGSSVIYVAVLASDVWVHASSQVEYTTRIVHNGAAGTIHDFGRTVAVSDGNLLASGYQITGSTAYGVVVAYVASYPYKAWATKGAVLQGSTASFGVSLQFVASQGGTCRLGVVDQGWKCRMLIGEPNAGKVHIYSMSSDGFWLIEQVLSGPSDFGYAISTSELGPGMVLVGAPSANGQDGLVQIFGYSTQQEKFVLRGALQSPRWLSKGGLGYALDHVVSGNEAIIVAGAPHGGRALIWRTSSSTAFISSDTVLVGVVDGRTRAYPTMPGSDNTMLGASVGLNGQFVYIGAPRFNNNKAYLHSIGAVHVAAYCWSNHYVDTSSQTKGAVCQACPAPATSPGGQTSVCEGCADMPEILPARASVTAGCTVTCEGSYAYDARKNQCLYRHRTSTGAYHGEAASGDAAFVIIALMAGTCLVCCCCYLFKGPIYHQHIQQMGLSNLGNVSEVAPQPRLAVRMAAYPMIRLTEGMNLPNDADCCVICLDNFKVGDRLRMLGCDHAFHMPCIDNWLDTHTSCPLCNAQLETIELQADTPARRCQQPRASAPASTTAPGPSRIHLQHPEIEELEVQRNPTQGMSRAEDEALQQGVDENSSGSRPSTGSSSRVVNVMPARGVGVSFSG